MGEKTAAERHKEEIREQINALRALAERLPESKDEALEQLDRVQKSIRVIPRKEREPPEGETYMGS